MGRDEPSLSDEQLLRLNRLCNDYESACQAGPAPRMEPWRDQLPAELHAAALHELLPLELEYRRRAGETVAFAELAQRFPAAPAAWLAQLCSPLDSADDIPQRLGDYRLLQRIGGGGMGTVYQAEHERMGRVVALKVLRRELQANPALVQRFFREVRAAARLTHPHIVAALDAREQDGLHFLITEFVDGCDLDELVRRRGPLPVGEAVDYVVQAARGLEYAHRQGVVHRDIKPANLLLSTSGVVKVLDMGLARLDESPAEAGATKLTQSGMVVGTAAYMAPEQARDMRRADARSDLYSLGCTLYFLLTGQPAFRGETVVDTILSHVREPIPSLAAANVAVPPGLEAAFRRLLAKEPAERFQTAAEAIAALAPFGACEWSRESTALPNELTGWRTSAAAPTVALPVTEPIRLQTALPENSPSRRRWLAAGAASAALVGLTAGGVWLWPRGEQQGGDYALEFNGRSSYVAVRSLAPVAGASYTVEVIVQPAEDSAAQPANVVSWLGPDWMAVFLDGQHRWGVARRWQGAAHLRAARSPARLGQRVHLAAVFAGEQLRLFVDGVEAETEPVEYALGETSGGLFIGGADEARLAEPRYFRGLIEAVRISPGVRYSAAFTPPAMLSADGETLVSFPFTEGTGIQTASSNPAWPGELVGTVWRRR